MLKKEHGSAEYAGMSSPHPPRAGRSARSGRPVRILFVQLSAAVLGFVLVALLVVTSSRAAFVAQTDNTTNSVSSAGITLTDNDAGSAMFNNVTGLVPGTNVDRCITVTWTGTTNPGAVKLYVAGAPTGGLAPYLNLTVDMLPSTGDGFGSCTNFTGTPTNVYTGTLNAFATSYQNYAGGLSTTWTPTTATSPDARTFRFRVSVQSSASAQNQTTTFGFTWETQTP